MIVETVVFAALLLMFAVPLAYAFAPDDLAALRRWRAAWQARRLPPTWRPEELREMARELAELRAAARLFDTRREQLEANRRLRLAGFQATLVGRAERLP